MGGGKLLKKLVHFVRVAGAFMLCGAHQVFHHGTRKSFACHRRNVSSIWTDMQHGKVRPKPAGKIITAYQSRFTI
ncbi:hypothetical protein ATR01nite_05750 [Acetobacter tropicalis]|uniref:Uncharacterized protein n=1 Tax=Acetobacter tropicalis TaxID=104102 RepID=A0A511FJW2_9PROT|nr:hypothetical protein ATR01nite_05750 [Acetobacter tropicalis]